MEKLQAVAELIETMMRAIVTCPDEVMLHISEEKDEKGEFTQVNIKVAPSDIARAIGKKGANAEAIRRVAVLAAVRVGYEKLLFVRVDAPRVPSNHFYSEE